MSVYRFSRLATETSRLTLVAALAIILPVAAHATDYVINDNVTTQALTTGDTGTFTAPASTAGGTFTGIGTIGNGTVVIQPTTLDNVGTLNLTGTATANGTIGGPSNRINTLNMSGGIGTYLFNGNTFAANTIVSTGSTATFNGTTNSLGAITNGGVVALGANTTLSTTGITSGAAGVGDVRLAGGSTFNYSGNIGSAGLQSHNLVSTGNNTLTASGGVRTIYTSIGVDFTNNGTLTVGGTGTIFNGDDGIKTNTTGQGTLNLASNVSTQSITGTGNGDIGTSANRLNTISFANATGSTLTVDGDVYLTNGMNLRDNTLSIGATANTTLDTGTALTTDAAGRGTINLTGAGTKTVNSAIGNSTFAINAVNLTGSGNTTLNGANNYINTTNFGANSTLALGTGAALNGAITTSTNNTGTVAVASNNTVTGNIGSSGARLAALSYTGGSGNTLTLGGNSFLTAFNNSGSGNTVSLGANAGINTVNAIIGGANTYRFAANNSASSVGGLVSASTVNLSGSAAVLDTSAVTSGVANRTRYTYAQNNDGSAIVAPGSITESNAVTGVNFRNVFNSNTGNDINNQLQVMALQNGYYTTAAANVAGNGEFASYLANNVEGGNTDRSPNTVFTYLETLSTQIGAGNTSGVKNTLRQGQAQAQSNVASNLATTGFVNVVDNRATNIRLASKGMGGMNTGDVTKPGQAVWAQAFGASGNQNERQSQVGFDSQIAGAAVGYDREVAKNTIVGIAGAYSNGRIETDSVQQHTNVNTYQGSIYGHTYVAPEYFVEGQAGGSYSEYDSSRTITAGATAANADYHGWGYFANLKAGRDFALRNEAILTPFASLTYIGNSFEDYTESGAGGLNLNVDSDQTNLLTGRIGTELAKNYTYDTSKIRPSLHLAYLYDIVQDNQIATTSFIGTGTAGSFNTNGIDQSRSGFNAGVGINLLTVNQLDLTASYDYEWRDRYDGHSGLLRARYNF